MNCSLLVYRNTTDFCWFLYSAMLLDLLALIVFLYVESLGFSTYKIMSSPTEIILLLSLKFECQLFLFLPYFLWLELPILCWIEMVKACILVLFLLLEGKELLSLSSIFIFYASNFVVSFLLQEKSLYMIFKLTNLSFILIHINFIPLTVFFILFTPNFSSWSFCFHSCFIFPIFFLIF